MHRSEPRVDQRLGARVDRDPRHRDDHRLTVVGVRISRGLDVRALDRKRQVTFDFVACRLSEFVRRKIGQREPTENGKRTRHRENRIRRACAHVGEILRKRLPKLPRLDDHAALNEARRNLEGTRGLDDDSFGA